MEKIDFAVRWAVGAASLIISALVLFVVAVFWPGSVRNPTVVLVAGWLFLAGPICVYLAIKSRKRFAILTLLAQALTIAVLSIPH